MREKIVNFRNERSILKADCLQTLPGHGFFSHCNAQKKTLTTKTIQTETVCNTKFQFIFQQLWGSLQHILNLFRNLWNLGSEKSEF